MDQPSTNIPAWINAAPQWQTVHPQGYIGLLWLKQVQNPPVCPTLEEEKKLLEENISRRFATEGIKDFAPVPAYEFYYKRYRKTYQVRQQIESIARNDRKIPRVAALVEAMFMAELKSGLLTAGHDTAALQFPLRLDAALGTEEYLRINGQPQKVKKDDMILSDQAGVIGSVIYGPDQRTRIVPQTTEALFVVYAPAGIKPEWVTAHLENLRSYALLVAPESTTMTLNLFPRIEYP